MQRVSAFLPSWDRRSSNSSSTKHNSHSGGGIFNWAARNSISSSHGNNTMASSPFRASHSAAKTLSRINVAAANSDQVQREAFWPSTLDMESLKAARILKSFCSDGFLATTDTETAVPAPATGREESTSIPGTTPEPRPPASGMRKIPRHVIQNAAGIAVFTCMRSGLWMTGSGGSGILIARKSDGTWSPPSGIMLHTPTLSFIIGVDVYDCVLVVTDLAALEAITQSGVILGEDVTLRNGPSATLDSDDFRLSWKGLDNTVLAYMKARGRLQSVNLQGCILTERANENERFYGAEVSQMDILAGNVARHVEETKPLFEVIKLAEGRTDYDEAVMQRTAVEPTPSDAIIAMPKSNASSPRPVFGIVKADDPDPFGILALEMAGLEIREAGSRLRPCSSQFDLLSNPRSPNLARFDRQSMDTLASRSNRASVRSLNTIKSQMTDAGTQTDLDKGDTPETSPSPGWSEDGREGASIVHVSELKETAAADDVDSATMDLTLPEEHTRTSRSSVVSPRSEPLAAWSRSRRISSVSVAQVDTVTTPALETEVTEEKEEEEEEEEEDDEEYDTNDADDEDEDLDVLVDEEPVIFEVAQVQPTRTRAIASRMIQAKGSVVTIAKRIPPPLPMRSPARNSRCARRSDGGVDGSMALSPLRMAFSEADLRSEESSPQTEDAETAVTPAPIQTSKSADLGRVADQGAGGHLESVEARRRSRRAGEVDRAMSSIDATVLLSPEDDASTETETGENDAAATISHDQVAKLSADLARAIGVPLPDDVVADHDLIDDAGSQDDTGKDGETEVEEEEEKEEEEEEDDDDDDDDEEEEEEEEDDDDENDDNNDATTTWRAPIDTSDSTTTSHKHVSSIYTGLSEDRWSIDGSSLKTPTSERHASVTEYTTEDDIPKKTSREEELDAAEHQVILEKDVSTPIHTPLQMPIRST